MLIFFQNSSGTSEASPKRMDFGDSKKIDDLLMRREKKMVQDLREGKQERIHL